jgi:hypothetical protein
MFGLTRTKKYEEVVEDLKATRLEKARIDLDRWDILFELHQAEHLLKGTERQKVLADLQDALNLIIGYQRALHTIAAADPNVMKADALLKRWGMKSETQSYLGAKRPHPAEPSKQKQTVVDLASITETGKDLLDRLKQEEEKWGDEAYGSAHVRIEAEAIDEGEEKEPGYTRARVRFVDVGEDDPPALKAARETTRGLFEEFINDSDTVE